MTIIKKQCILKIVLSGVTILSHNGLEASIKNQYITQPDDAFSDVPNERLVQLVCPEGSSGPVDSRAFAELQSRFADMMLAKIASTRYRGADVDDLMQICSLSLLYAARRYDPSKGAAFSTFASVCVGNRLRDAIRAASAKKNDSHESFDDVIESAAMERVDPMTDPEARFIIEESVSELKAQIVQCLSPVEHDVFMDYYKGYTYEMTSEHLGIPVKAVDNALQRARRKLRALFPQKSGGDGKKRVADKHNNGANRNKDGRNGADSRKNGPAGEDGGS